MSRKKPAQIIAPPTETPPASAGTVIAPTPALPRPARIAAAHALKELGFNNEEIQKELGCGITTVKRDLKEEVPETWSDFGLAIKEHTKLREASLSAKVRHQIEQAVDNKEVKPYELIGLYKILQELPARRDPFRRDEPQDKPRRKSLQDMTDDELLQYA